MSDINTILETVIWEELEKELITKSCLEFVDLDIEFSPVTPCVGAEPCEAIKTVGENYIVGHQIVTPQILKVMRYRFLKNRKAFNPHNP